MATYYVNSGAGGSNTRADWTNAYTAFGSAVTAATADGDIIKVHVAHAEALAADTTYTFANNVRVICVDKDNSDALAVMNGTTQYIGNTSTNRSIALAGAYNVYFYGIALLVTGNDTLRLGATDGSAQVFENCVLQGGHASGGFRVGDAPASGGDIQTAVHIIGGTFGPASTTTAAYISVSGDLIVEGAALIASSTARDCLVRMMQLDAAGGTALFSGCDLSQLGTSPILGDCTTTVGRCTLNNCRLPSSYVALAAQTVANRSGGELWMYNCFSGDEHVHLAHHNSLGETTCSTGGSAIYATSNICDANLSWKIVGTANATFYSPYRSPWIDVYHTGTSAITPSLECVRSGSATAYNNDTLWSEWSYQGTSGYPLATIVTSDRMLPLASAAAQTTGALGASDWTGENATSWFGKLAPTASFTPVEVGHIRARVCVAGANTVYVDPQIRGLS